MSAGRLALFLVDETNEFQRLLRGDAEETARRLGFEVETHFTGPSLSRQLGQLQACLDSTPRPEAFLVMCVNDRGLQRVARRAVQSGAHWISLNQCEDDLQALRGEHPGQAIATVCPDEVETGRIQGRQFRRLLPDGGRILYVLGGVRSVAARDRRAGMQEAVAASALELIPLEAGWTAEAGRDAVLAWLRIAMRAGRHFDLIGCQSDTIARGARAAIEEAAREFGRPELRNVPLTGCDGSPGVGQAMVRAGELRATVVLPRATGPAVETIARFLLTGALPPPLQLLKGHSFPAEEEIMPGEARAAVAAGGAR